MATARRSTAAQSRPCTTVRRRARAHSGPPPRAGIQPLLVALLLAALVGCNAARDAGDGDDPNEVARDYAPELSVDLDRMERMESGLRYEDLEEGTGAEATAGQVVTVHYTGWLPDGTQFDSSRERGQPFQVPIGEGHVIRGVGRGHPGDAHGRPAHPGDPAGAGLR